MIRIEIDEMQFQYNKVTLVFSAFCDVCGVKKTNQQIDLQSLAKLNVGCSACEIIPSFTHDIYPLLIGTVLGWGYNAGDVQAVEEKLRKLPMV